MENGDSRSTFHNYTNKEAVLLKTGRSLNAVWEKVVSLHHTKNLKSECVHRLRILIISLQAKPKMMIDLKKQQQEALQDIKTFLLDDSQEFILKGYAGTGKTTLVSAIYEEAEKLHRKPVLCAPTGRAAKVLHDKTHHGASTIHRAIYVLERLDTKEESDDFTYYFPVRIQQDPQDCVFIVDEASMVGAKQHHHDIFQFGSGCLLDDLITSAQVMHGGKIIFVGDPAQLPPVGENKSCALDENYFKALGHKVRSFELTEVLRQDEGSLVLKNAMKIRDLLKEDPTKRHDLVFERDGKSVSDIQTYEMPQTMLNLFPNPALGHSVIVTYSNRAARDFNRIIRSRIYPGSASLHEGDRLIVVANHYSSDRNAVDLVNGDFVTVIGVSSETETQAAKITVERDGKKVQETLRLRFRDVRLKMDDGFEISCKIIDDLLDSVSPNLTTDQMRALYVNFCMRHPKLKRTSEMFKMALKNDPYFNALRVKYGYAITGHKSQGGEWNTVFVDYTGRTGLDNDSLRWAYTVTTRASSCLYGACMPNVTTFSRLRVEAIATATKFKVASRSFSGVDDDPFHEEKQPDALKAKYFSVAENQEGTPYKIVKIVSRPYLEIYHLDDGEQQLRVDVHYNKGFVFSPKVAVLSEKSDELLRLFSNERTLRSTFHYEPSNDSARELFSKMGSLCSELDVAITNVYEHLDKYRIDYFLQTDGRYSGICFCFNKNGYVTYAKPFSDLGAEDHKLSSLTQKLQQQ